MAQPMVTDDQWAVIEPLLPKPRRYAQRGRPGMDDRAVRTSILFVVKIGTPWEYLTAELGCGPAMTRWRRLRDWQKTDVWKRLHRVLLNCLRAVADSGSVRAVGAGTSGAQLDRSPQTG